MDNDGIYRTGEAAARAGVSEPALRMWERRYGLVPSARSAGGHRRYSESDVAVVRRAVALIAAGVMTDAAVTTARAEVQEDPSQSIITDGPWEEIRRRRDSAVLVRQHLVDQRQVLVAGRELIIDSLDASCGLRQRPATTPSPRPSSDSEPNEADPSR
jgi:DNA-binding transcriptional MerR regulator